MTAGPTSPAAAARPRAAGWLTDLAAALRALADRVESEPPDPAALAGELETLHGRALQAVVEAAVQTALQTALVPTAAVLAAVPVPSRALGIADVVTRTGMSRGWLYREARAGRLPFARRIPGTRRVVFDETGLARWLARRVPR